MPVTDMITFRPMDELVNHIESFCIKLILRLYKYFSSSRLFCFGICLFRFPKKKKEMLLLQKYRFLRRGQNKLPFFFED